MFTDPNKREAFYHSVLAHKLGIPVSSLKGDRVLRQHLATSQTLEEAFKKTGLPETVEGNLPLEQIVKEIERITLDFEIVTINDKRFPDAIKKDPNGCAVIYARGNLSLVQEKPIGVVGTRKLTDTVDIEEGKKVLQRLLNKSYTIVSGLATGCDALAHRYALEHEGKTIAVLGTPINRTYPSANRRLQEQIAEHHLLVSQYPIGLRTFPSYFAHRNKTTVSLSQEGLVVIRAGDSSGTQHAVKECIAQDKPLYVLENNLNQGYNWVKKYSFKVPNRSGGKK